MSAPTLDATELPVRPAPAAAAPPVATVRDRTGWVSRGITLVAVVVPPLGLGAAMAQLWGAGFRPLDLALLVGLYVASGVGITVGFHRYFTHRGFETGPVLRAVLAILGSITLQGPVTQWVTDHRKHHAMSDRPGDPHSPHLHGPGMPGALRGLFHAHVGWMFVTKGMERGDAYGRDLYGDPLVRWIDRLYLVWVALSLGLPLGVGALVRHSWAGAVEAMVWGGLLRIFLFHHATFAVNSVCHMFGRRPYASRDRSTNNRIVALLTFGEGWHNNHHAFPRAVRHGIDRWQPDPAWWCIRGLAAVGLARNLKLAPADRSGRLA